MSCKVQESDVCPCLIPSCRTSNNHFIHVGQLLLGLGRGPAFAAFFYRA